MILVLTETYDHLSPSPKSLSSYTCSKKKLKEIIRENTIIMRKGQKRQPSSNDQAKDNHKERKISHFWYIVSATGSGSQNWGKNLRASLENHIPKGQRLIGRKVKRLKFQKLSDAILIKCKAFHNGFMCILKLNRPISRNFALELRVYTYCLLIEDFCHCNTKLPSSRAEGLCFFFMRQKSVLYF